MPQIECDFSCKDELTALFIQEAQEVDKDGDAIMVVDEDEIGYLPWRSPEFVFNSIKPFFDAEVYSSSILKGLVISSGGLTESTLKAS